MPPKKKKGAKKKKKEKKQGEEGEEEKKEEFGDQFIKLPKYGWMKLEERKSQLHMSKAFKLITSIVLR